LAAELLRQPGSASPDQRPRLGGTGPGSAATFVPGEYLLSPKGKIFDEWWVYYTRGADPRPSFGAGEVFPRGCEYRQLAVRLQPVPQCQVSSPPCGIRVPSQLTAGCILFADLGAGNPAECV